MVAKSLFRKGYSILGWLLLFLGVLTLGSCSIQKERVAVSKPLDIDSSIREAFLAKDFVPSEWNNEKWWEMFNDPQLNHYIEIALEKNPTLQAAIETVTLAHDAAKQTFSSLLPKVGAQLTEDLVAFKWKREGFKVNEPLLPSNIFPDWINYFGSMLSFRWVLDIWGKQTKLYKAALDDVRAEMASTAYKKLLLSIQVATCYVTLQHNLKREALHSKSIQAYQEILLVQQKMQNYALADEMDLIATEKQIYQMEEAGLRISENIQKAQHQLKVYMGLSPSDPSPMQTPIADFCPSFPFPEDVSIDLISKRPDIVSKIWAIQAAMKRVNAAKVAFLPSINLASFSGYFTFTYKELMKPRAWFTSILPGASLPLFEGLKLRANLKYKLRQYNLAVYEYNSLLLTVAQDIVDSITSFRIVSEKINVHQDLLGKSQQDLELTSMRYQYGLDSVIDVLNKKIDWLSDLNQYEQYSELRLLTILNLIKSIGGGYHCPEAQIDMEKDFIYE